MEGGRGGGKPPTPPLPDRHFKHCLYHSADVPYELYEFYFFIGLCSLISLRRSTQTSVSVPVLEFSLHNLDCLVEPIDSYVWIVSESMDLNSWQNVIIKLFSATVRLSRVELDKKSQWFGKRPQRCKLPIGYNWAPHIRPQNCPFLWTDPQAQLVRHLLTHRTYNPKQHPCPSSHNALDRQTNGPTDGWSSEGMFHDCIDRFCSIESDVA